MEARQICPKCGAVNPIHLTRCRACGELLFEPEPVKVPKRFSNRIAPLQAFPHDPRRFLGWSEVRPARRYTRRKALTLVLGTGVLLALGDAGLTRLSHNIQLALNSQGFPYDLYGNFTGWSYSPDLNTVAMVNNANDPHVYIWNYTQQQLVSLPIANGLGKAAWSPDNRYLLYQVQHQDNSALEMWDVQTQKRVKTLNDNDYVYNASATNFDSSYNSIRWSPDGSRIALLLQNSLTLLDAQQMQATGTLPVSANAELFAWSPDSRRLAVLVNKPDTGGASIQIWDLTSRTQTNEITLQGTTSGLSTLAWSPNSEYLAVISRNLFQIFGVASRGSAILKQESGPGKLAWSPNSRYIVHVNTLVNTTRVTPLLVWDIVRQQQVRTFERDAQTPPAALTWSSDGRWIRAIGEFYQRENWSWFSS